MLYQCITIGVKIYDIYSTVVSNNTKYIGNGVLLPHIKITYNIVVLLVVIVGLPIVSDTMLEIIGDAKYIIKQMLAKKK